MSVRLFRFGIDYLRYNFCPEFSSRNFDYLFVGLSENSKQKLKVDFLGHVFTSVTYLETKTLRILQFYSGNYHVLTLVQYMDVGLITTVSYSMTFEGTFFAIPELLTFLITFTSRFEKSLSVSRIDIALDCNIKTNVLWKWKKTQFKKDNVYRSDSNIQTFYLGRKLNNKKYFIRVYDKRIDSMSKGKFVLFRHYLKEKIVTRIEVEIHTITIKVLNITPQAILGYLNANIIGDENGVRILEQWFASLCVNEQGTCFYSLRHLSFNNCEKLVTAKFTGRSKEIEQHRYVRVFLTMAKKLQSMKFDVLGFLAEYLDPL